MGKLPQNEKKSLRKQKSKNARANPSFPNDGWQDHANDASTKNEQDNELMTKEDQRHIENAK